MSTKWVPHYFSPAISKNALIAIKEEIWKWKLESKTSSGIEDLAKMYNPIIRGWNEYYGKFCPSALKKFHSYLNGRLAIWANRKYKKLHGHRVKCFEWLRKVAKQRPKLFAHWTKGALPIG